MEKKTRFNITRVPKENTTKKEEKNLENNKTKSRFNITKIKREGKTIPQQEKNITINNNVTNVQESKNIKKKGRFTIETTQKQPTAIGTELDPFSDKFDPKKTIKVNRFTITGKTTRLEKISENKKNKNSMSLY